MLVVGAGIVGASIAYHLAVRGVPVTVIDRDGPASQASSRSFAWINASPSKKPFNYHLLSRLGVLAYRRLQADLDLDLSWGGSIQWCDQPEQQTELRADVAQQQGHAVPIRMVLANTVQHIEPKLNLNGAAEVAYCESDGAIDAHTAVRELLAGAERHGARLMFPCRLTGIRVRDGELCGIETTRGAMTVERLILASGVATHQLAALAGIKFAQAPTAGIIVTTAPVPPLLNTVVVAPDVYLRQRPDGRMVLGEPSGPLRPQTSADKVHGERIRAMAQRYVPALGAAEIESVTIGMRPMPADGKPVIGAAERVPHIYLAVMHSGVSLAGIIGRLAAMELVDEVRCGLLNDFRVERFAPT